MRNDFEKERNDLLEVRSEFEETRSDFEEVQNGSLGSVQRTVANNFKHLNLSKEKKNRLI